MLEEFVDDEVCVAALEENVATIEHQRQRIHLVEVEKTRRGVGKMCGEQQEEEAAAAAKLKLNPDSTETLHLSDDHPPSPSAGVYL